MMSQLEKEPTDTLPRPAYVPPLPHPAWRHDPLPPTPASALKPEEFWKRLGL